MTWKRGAAHFVSNDLRRTGFDYGWPIRVDFSRLAQFGAIAPACSKPMTARRGSPKVTREQLVDFLATLKLNGNVTQSAKSAGFAPSTAYELRNGDEKFAKAWLEALAIGRECLRDSLIEEAVRRGRDGTEEYVVSHGQVVTDPENGGYLRVKKYSDGLMSKLLDGLDPETFRAPSPQTNIIIPAELQPDPPPTPDEPGPDKPVL